MLPEPLELSLDRAIEAAQRNDHHYAFWAMRLLIAENPSYRDQLLQHPSAAVRLTAFRASADAKLLAHPYRSCPLLGPAGDALDPVHERIIDGILTAHWERWISDPILPKRASLFSDSKIFRWKGADPLKVAIISPKHINCNPDYIEADVYYHLSRSSVQQGFEVRCFNTDEIQYESFEISQRSRRTRPLQEGLNELTEFLAEFRPDIVITDGNYISTGDSLEPSYWDTSKAAFDFKLMVVLGDIHDDSHVASFWHDCADLLCTFHGEAIDLIGKKNAITFPTFPFDETMFDADVAEDIDVSFIGSDVRRRREWTEPFIVAGIKTTLRLHDRSKATAPGYEEFYNLIKRSKLIFNNGFLSLYTSITTGRLFEAILSRTLVLQQNGAPCDDHFVPFVHYVPVTNIDQMIAFSRFFLKHETWRQKITNAAREFWDQHYATRLNWNFICATLYPDHTED
jgi:hypothetical protein